MAIKTIENYGKVTVFNIAGKTYNKYLCRWVKTVISDNIVFARRYYSGTATIIAYSIEQAIIKASALKGYKPNLIQRI